MAWMTPKTDWNATNAINYGDFNRIENNILELQTYLVSIQYAAPTPTATNTTRTVTSFDYISSINRIENNLDAIRQAFITPAGYLSMRTWSVGTKFDYNDANRLESNTKSLLDLGMNVYQSFRYSGSFVCGSDGMVV